MGYQITKRMAGDCVSRPCLHYTHASICRRRHRSSLRLRLLASLFATVLYPVIYSFTPWSPLNLGTTYHDVVEQSRIEEKRRDERCVCCTQNEAKFWVYYRSFGCRVLLKEEEKNAHIKNLATPLVPNFKILGGALPQARNLIGACSLYAINAPMQVFL